MNNNYLLPYLKKFYEEVTYFGGNLYIIDSMLKSKSQQLWTDFKVPQDLWSTITCFRDLSQLEGGSNLHNTGFGYQVATENLQEQTERSISYVSCATVSNVYEVFDSFIKNTLATVYMQTEDKTKFGLKKQFDSYEDIRKALRTLKKDGPLIKIAARLSPYYAKYEKHNIWGYDMLLWYIMIEKIRHQIVHNRQNLTNMFFEDWTEDEKQLFDTNFSIIDTGDSIHVILTYARASHILNTFMELAHLIFKGLSIDLSLDPKYS